MFVYSVSEERYPCLGICGGGGPRLDQEAVSFVQDSALLRFSVVPESEGRNSRHAMASVEEVVLRLIGP